MQRILKFAKRWYMELNESHYRKMIHWEYRNPNFIFCRTFLYIRTEKYTVAVVHLSCSHNFHDISHWCIYTLKVLANLRRWSQESCITEWVSCPHLLSSHDPTSYNLLHQTLHQRLIPTNNHFDKPPGVCAGIAHRLMVACHRNLSLCVLRSLVWHHLHFRVRIRRACKQIFGSLGIWR